MAKKILFLCTGNYYRSRFAEHCFNHFAAASALGWNADSCGLRVQAGGVRNIGALSVFAIEALETGAISPERPLRFPRQVSAAELHGSHLIVALNETEHRPLLQSLFPEFVNQVKYWNVHDLDKATPDEALPQIESLVRELIQELAAASFWP